MNEFILTEKNGEISRWKAQINQQSTWKLNSYVCEHTYIYSLLVEKDLCEFWNISVKFLCALLVYLCLSLGDLSILLVRFPFLYSHFCAIGNLALSLWSSLKLTSVSEKDAISSSSFFGGSPFTLLPGVGDGVGKGLGNSGCCSSGCVGNLELVLWDEWLEYL